MADFAAALAGSDGAGLAATATHLVLPVGVPRPVLVLAEAPGEEEDRTGEAFVGAPGQLARRMLASIGIGIGIGAGGDGPGPVAMLAYLVPWRPPGGRAPGDSEIAACLPFLMRLIQLSQPRVVLAMGSIPAKALLGAARRGRWGEAAIPGLEKAVPVLPTGNPAVLLKQPGQKAASWSDLRMLRRRIDEITTS